MGELFTDKYLIIRGPAAGTVVHKTNLVPVSKLLYRNVRILQGAYAGKYVQVTDILIPNEIKTLNGTLIKIDNTTLVGTARHLQKKGDFRKW